MWGERDNLRMILNTWQQLVLDGCDPAGGVFKGCGLF